MSFASTRIPFLKSKFAQYPCRHKQKNHSPFWWVVFFSFTFLCHLTQAQEARKSNRDWKIEASTNALKNVSPTLFGEEFSSLPLYLVGTDSGLFLVTVEKEKYRVKTLLKNKEVYQILLHPEGVFFITSEGIAFASDLQQIQYLNEGILPSYFLELKKGDFRTQEMFTKAVTLEYLSEDSSTLLFANQKDVYISEDRGLHWMRVPEIRKEFSSRVLTSAHMYKEKNSIRIVVSDAFSVKSFWWNGNQQVTQVQNMSQGLYPQGAPVDEVNSIFSMKYRGKSHLFLSQNWNGNISLWDEENKKWDGVFFASTKEKPASKWKKESVFFLNNIDIAQSKEPYALLDGKIILFHLDDPSRWSVEKVENIEPTLKAISQELGGVPILSLAYLEKEGKVSWNLKNIEYIFQEEYKNQSPFSRIVANKKGIYVPLDVLYTQKKSVFSLFKEKGLDTLIIDLKDDSGALRFQTKNPLILEKGYVSQYAINLEKFIKERKKEGFYIIGRMPVFKDKILYQYNHFQYALKSRKTQEPFQGIKKNGKLISEYWVNMYDPGVWQYNLSIMKEAQKLGIDELQLDYIRFPTDGTNLSDIDFDELKNTVPRSYLLYSFLKYVRENISIPIGIDVYGYSGWIRSNGNTGQQIDLLSSQVDVISPMFYPSHFAEGDLEYSPMEKKPYRIYAFGTLHSSSLVGYQTLIRPYVQFFYLSSSEYDRKYYGENYVNQEIKGIFDFFPNNGFLLWKADSNYIILKKTDPKTFLGQKE